MARNLLSQSRALLKSRFNLNSSDGEEKSRVVGKYKSVNSIRSANESVLALAKICEELGLKRVKQLTPEMGEAYLNERKDAYFSQKTLDRDRKAISLALNAELPRIKALKIDSFSSRSYTRNQVEIIAERMSERNSLALKIAFDAGLRAHELLTLRRLDEGEKSNARHWTDDRFYGKDGVRYVVVGKGGLAREVMISKHLSQQLETKRLLDPVVTQDRRVNYVQRYDIGGGNALSSSFTKLSNKTLGFSTGLHGVRHSYAQMRLEQIQYEMKTSREVAREVVAQELGHFRGEITNVYLR